MRAAASRARDNVVPLRAASGSDEADAANRAVIRVRRDISLLQGYADMLEGLSSDQHIEVLKAMGDKVRDLTVALHPFIDPSAAATLGLDDYRSARSRQRRLMADYRFLMSRLKDSVADTHGTIQKPRAMSRRGQPPTP